MFQFLKTDYSATDEFIAKQDIENRMMDHQFIIDEISRFRSSNRCKAMVTGCRYYEGKQDILNKKRTAIGENGQLTEIENLPNSKIVDNQYQKMVDQKANYIVGQPFVIQSENKQFVEAIKPYLLTKKFFRLMKSIVKDCLNCGVAWLYPHYDDKGELIFTRFKPYEIIPEWADADHTILDSAIRVYEVLDYENKTETTKTKVEVYNPDGIYYFELSEDSLIPEDPFYQAYFSVTDTDGSTADFNWDKIPLIPFRYNAEEIPLISRCKSMQDGLNKIESMWEDQMEEDSRNTILVLVNYDGQDLGEFRRNLATYGAVKVRSGEGANGDVKTLQVEVNAENYKSIIAQFKKAIIENAMGYDAKDDRVGSNANEMNIKSMYSDIELDANGMDTEFQAAFEELVWFLCCHLSNIHAGDYDPEDFTVEFNRNIMLNESDAISNCQNSVGLISNETILANHPWVDDVEAEMAKLKKQKDQEMEQFDPYGDFGKKPDDQKDPDDDPDDKK